jgi:FtsP/CotA-like multicopper oxidase with cupredoxin domain
MNRRNFLNVLMTGTAALGTPALFHSIEAWAQAAPASQPGGAARELRIVSRTLEINGKSASVYGLAQADGTRGLTFDAGAIFDVVLANKIDAPTLIHWHGLTPPWQMDGVPDNPAQSLAPGETRGYSFPVGAGGTYWMHAHTLQEQNLLAAPLIVRTAADTQRDEQEVVILLHDFSFTPAEEILAKLKKSRPVSGMPMGGGMGSMGQGAMMGRMGQMPGMKMPMKMPGMGMPGMGPMDLNDIDYDAYLANDRTLDDPQVVTVEKGGRVRLRIINGATATGFTIRSGNLGGELVAVDGQDIQPIKGESFPIAMGQRLDIRLQLPSGAGAYPILALRERAKERAGIILATAGAAVTRVPVSGSSNGAVLGLDLEQKARALAPLAERPADRRFNLMLTGDMAGYSWGIEGADALKTKRGERIEITFHNMSMMAHPMHLHGHRFQVVAIDGKRLEGAVRDTVLVPPMRMVTVAFDADNPGRWPLHCHHLYHMVTGMMSYVAYEDVG